MFLVSVGQVYWILGPRVMLLVGVRSSLLDPRTWSNVVGRCPVKLIGSSDIELCCW